MVGRSTALREVENMIAAVAPSSMTVLIQGESGVGKELVAREVHEHDRWPSAVSQLDCCTPCRESLFSPGLFGRRKRLVCRR
ncbi:MAG: sigma 54-interacting transcriptional regulator [Thiolinea sp.]